MANASDPEKRAGSAVVDRETYRIAVLYLWMRGEMPRTQAERRAGTPHVEGFFGVLPTREMLQRILAGDKRDEFMSAQGYPSGYSRDDALRDIRAWERQEREQQQREAERLQQEQERQRSGLVRLGDVLDVILSTSATTRSGNDLWITTQAERDTRTRIAARLSEMETLRPAASPTSAPGRGLSQAARDEIKRILFVTTFEDRVEGNEEWNRLSDRDHERLGPIEERVGLIDSIVQADY